MARQTNLTSYFSKRPPSGACSDAGAAQKRAKTICPTAGPAAMPDLSGSSPSLPLSQAVTAIHTSLEAAKSDAASPRGSSEVSQAVSSRSATPPSPTPVAMGKLPKATFQPFQHRPIWVCPYKSIGKCSHSQDHFPTFMGLAQHVRQVHASDDLVTTYDERKMHDGTLKIPCPRGCGHMSTTHQKANQHAKMSECTAPPPADIECTWHPYSGCQKVYATAKGLANHSRSHTKDPRSPYQCQMQGCGLLHSDLYQLAMHEERCTGKPAVERRTSPRYCLTAPATDNVPPSVIIVNRSSAERPKGWKAETGDYEEGLLLLGKQYLSHYAAWSDYPGGSAVMHSCYDCPTCYLPSPAVDNSFLETKDAYRSDKYRAFKFTQAIVNDIQAANQTGITPTLVSVGVDGWACDRRTVLPWLQDSNLRFRIVVRMNGLNYGMTDRFADLHHEVYWCTGLPTRHRASSKPSNRVVKTKNMTSSSRSGKRRKTERT